MAAIAIGGQAGYHPSRVLVRFRGTPTFLPGSANARALSPSINLHLVDIPSALSVPEAVARYKTDPNVVYAEPDYVVKAVTTPNDTSFSLQWDMTNISAESAWSSHTDSHNVTAAVIDTGIDFSHPDLTANIYTDASVTPVIHGYTCMNGVCAPGGADDFGATVTMPNLNPPAGGK